MDEAAVKRMVIMKMEEFHARPGPVRVRRLGMGENNLNFRVDIGRKSFVVRISLRKELECNLAREFDALKRIPEGVGPKPVFIDSSKKWIPHAYAVLTYLEGNPVRRWTKRHLRLHARKLALLHKKSYPYCSDFITRHKRLDIVKRFRAHVPDFHMRFDEDTLRIIAGVDAYFQKKADLFLSMRRFSLIHMDPGVDNILFTKDDVHYIDWEWVRIRDPAEDLSRFYYPDFSLLPWAIRLDGERWEYFIEEYLKVRKDKTLRDRVRVWNTYYLLTDMLYFQWKFAHFSEERSDLSREHFETAVKLMKRSLWRRFQ